MDDLRDRAVGICAHMMAEYGFVADQSLEDYIFRELSECSRLASRVEQEHKIAELIRADREVAENRVLELEKLLRCALDISDSSLSPVHPDRIGEWRKQSEKLLAGAHAEEKE